MMQTLKDLLKAALTSYIWMKNGNSVTLTEATDLLPLGVKLRVKTSSWIIKACASLSYIYKLQNC